MEYTWIMYASSSNEIKQIKLMEEKVKQTDGWYIPGGTDPLTPSQRSKYEKGLSPYRRDVITGKYEVNKGKYV